MVKSIQKLEIRVDAINLKPLVIFGVEAGKVRLEVAKHAQRQSAWEGGITDVRSEAGWAPRFQPIVKTLLNMGLKLREIHGNRDFEEIVIVEN